eukprot:SAG31_NODE_1841_length_7117_cov_12.976207_1_plen_218_part_00
MQVHFGSCWTPTCFRGIFDDFATDEEAAHILALLRPSLTEASNDGRSGYIGVWGSVMHEPTLAAIVRRMERLLEDEFGATGAVVASANARGYDMTDGNFAHAGDKDRNLEQQFLAGQFAVQSAAALHWDNAKKVDWLYTALLYIGTDDVRRGHTIFVDELGDEKVQSGLLVAHKRGRLLVFSSGPENIHTGLNNAYGYRSLFQVWFKCTVPHAEREL